MGRTWSDYMGTAPIEDRLHQDARLGDLASLVTRGLGGDIDRKDAKGYTALMLAAYHGHFDFSQYLISQGADPNAVDAGGNSILMGVAFKGHADVAALLLKSGARAEYQNQKKQTALDFAQMFGRSNVVRLIRSQQNLPTTFSWLDRLASWRLALNPMRRM